MPEPAAASSDASNALRFLTVQVAGRAYALPAEAVAEVMRVPPLTRVPQSPRALLGVANLRGSVVPVTSLRGLLGMDEAALPPTARAIVLDLGLRVALVVDAVRALVAVAPERVQSEQAELGAVPGERVHGSFDDGAGEATKILDTRTLLDAAFAQLKRGGRQVRPGGRPTEFGKAEAPVAQSEMLVTFDVAGQEFALAVGAVQEILPAEGKRMVMARADTPVLGVTSLRGALLPLLSLRVLLGFPADAGNARERVIVTKVGGVPVGLVADRARAIVAAAPELVDPVPAAIAARQSGEAGIRAIYRGDAGRRLISILSPDHLFREDVMQRVNAQRGGDDENAAPAVQARTADLTFLVFRLGADEFALPIDAVDEVAQVPAQITRVPKTPKFLEGVVNLRGTVLPVVDQRRRFDMPKAEHPEGRRLIVVRTERHRAGLIVDSVSDVLRVAPDAVGEAPALTDEIAKLVRGVINLETAERIVLVLDPRELLTRSEQGLLDSFESRRAQANA
jgi:purine-binding chemotaxis protein CheW